MMLSSKSAGADNSKRANVIKEIYKTENDYLGHLRNLVDVSVHPSKVIRAARRKVSF